MKSESTHCIRLALFAVIASVPLLAGAVCGINPGQACTLIAVPSVQLNIRDAQDAPLPNATIVYKRNFAAPVTVTCNGDCDSVVLTWEQPGHFEFRVTSEGFADATGTADVYLDEVGCHVITESRTVVLDAS